MALLPYATENNATMSNTLNMGSRCKFAVPFWVGNTRPIFDRNVHQQKSVEVDLG